MIVRDPPEFWLYGSVARGEVDGLSDIDVLVVGEFEERDLAQLPYPKERLSIVRYDWAELEHMAAYGSLFLHHVSLEGRPLVVARNGSRLSTLLDGLPRYVRAHRELASFVTVLEDVERSLARDHSPTYELSVIATALRHACILGCYAIDRPRFGRASAFAVFLPHAGLGAMVEDAQHLYGFRLCEDGRAPAPFDASTKDVSVWLSRARMVVAEVARYLDAEQ
jgi:predicted nucleotidyltransferase